MANDTAEHASETVERLRKLLEAAERDLRLRDACSPPLTRDETIRELEESVRRAVLRADTLEKERDEARARNDNLRDLFDRALADVFDGMGCLPECDTFGHEPECPAVHGHLAFRQLRARAESATNEAAALREALAELVRLKDLQKELRRLQHGGQWPDQTGKSHKVAQEIARCDEPAWKAARTALASVSQPDTKE